MEYSENRIQTMTSQTIKTEPLRYSGISVAVFDSIAQVSGNWDQAAPTSNIFLQSSYLNLLEKNAPTGMKFCYFLFYKNNQAIGVAIGQVQFFKADQNIKDTPTDTKTPCFFTAIGRYIKNVVANKVEFYTLVCGNLLLTGEHGFYFKEEGEIPMRAQFKIIEEALQKGKKFMKTRGTNISATLVKDFCEDNRRETHALAAQDFSEFTIQPNMTLDIRPHWKEQADYLSDMQSKYRVRAKRAFKKLQGVEKKEFNEERIKANSARLHELYMKIASNVGFNLLYLNENYLLALKQQYQDHFKLYGYYYEDRLIAFYTTIDNGEELEAHFLGFEKEFNRSKQVYLNILYDIVNVGIERQAKRVVFARTALEIKSSVGAVPEEMYCYFRHHSSISNRFLKPLFDYLSPEDEWVQRRPFKEGV